MADKSENNEAELHDQAGNAGEGHGHEDAHGHGDDHGGHSHDPLDPGHLIGHVKDATYFEVPWFLTPEGDGHLNLPQPLLPDHPVQPASVGFAAIDQQIEPLDYKLTKFMVLEVVAALLVAVVFITLAQRMKGGGKPKGRVWNLLEAILLFLRDEVARPVIDAHDHDHDDEHGHGEHHPHEESMHHEDDVAAVDIDAVLQSKIDAPAHEEEHEADKYMPFLWTLFFFILGCNLLGMVPWLGSPTGALAVTGTLAVITFGIVVGTGMMKLGPVGYWTGQVPSMDLPLPLAILLKPMIFMIEVVGLIIKHFVLSVRLFANMFAGHLVLAVLIAFVAVGWHSWLIMGIAPASILGAALLSILELFVAFLQAYIFTFLSAIFIGMAVHPH